MSRIVVFSGSGISADSGIATFRTGAASIWEEHDLDVVCNELTWKKNFRTVHDFYNARRAGLAGVEPNAAHGIVAAWQRDFDVVNMTQNIDDLFERAGCSDVVHLHGFLTEMHCEACGTDFDIGHRAWNVDRDACATPKGSGVCGCRKGIKPNVVFFHAPAPRYADMYRVLSDLKKDDVVVVSGTSGLVLDIDAMLFDKPGFKIWNNLEAPKSEIYDEVVLGGAAEAFVRIDGIVRDRVAPVVRTSDPKA